MIRILTSLVAIFTVGYVQAQTTIPEVPKLVIGITIDQLRGDYLQLFQSNFTERGLKRLLNDGLVYQNMKFEFPNLNEASTIATIYTGANPIYHGIGSPLKFSLEEKKEVSIFHDRDYIGNYTQDQFSPRALKASTITDELKIASQGNSDVFSFAPSATQALITAGYSGNGAYWVDDYTGKWASTTFFSNFHWAIDQENRDQTSFSARAWGGIWYPLLSSTSYKELPYSRNVSFEHSLGSDKETYKLFKITPFVNEASVGTAIRVIEKGEMGSRKNPDFISLTLYAGNYFDTDDYSNEIQDTYIRIDRNIEKLLDAVERRVGLKNALIFVTSSGYYNSYSQDISRVGTIESNKNRDTQRLNLPNKVFYTNRCESLLNMYLMAIYGKDGKWVDKFYDNKVYLNQDLIKTKNVSLEEIQLKAAQFVSDFSGVQEVYTLHQIRHGKWDPKIEYYRNGLTKETMGDLFVELEPGYKVLNENDPTQKEKQIRNNAIVCPVIFFGNGIKPQKINRTIKATEIAPSVTNIMRIRSPNATKEEALSELLFKTSTPRINN